MLYKVTPMLPAPEAQKPRAKEPGQPRKRRKSAIYDAEGQEVLITLMCLKCKSMKPLGQFGLRKMSDGAIRNQPWCRGCRGAAGTKKKVEVPVDAVAQAPVAEAPVLAVAPQVDSPEEAPQLAAADGPVEAPQPEARMVPVALPDASDAFAVALPPVGEESTEPAMASPLIDAAELAGHA